MAYSVKLLAVLCLAAGGLGCASRPPGSTQATWIERLGGVEVGTSSTRASRICDELLDGPTRRLVSITAARAAEPAAYSWPSGQIIVTRGLLALLDDDELLAAAIAHEVGHVLSRRDGKGVVVGLRGHQSGMGAEFRADAVGARLLEAAGLPPQAMAAMLAKVQNSTNLTPQRRTELGRRIQHLEAQHGREAAARR